MEDLQWLNADVKKEQQKYYFFVFIFKGLREERKRVYGSGNSMKMWITVHNDTLLKEYFIHYRMLYHFRTTPKTESIILCGNLK